MNPKPKRFTDELVRRLTEAERVAVLTGAGVSAESGVPTFRDESGSLWERFSPQELAHVEAFLDNPELVQGWYAHRREVVTETEPNPGHRALADLEALVTDDGGAFLLATQNVDDLHRRAGSEHVVELHGNITRSYCIDCEREATEAEMRPEGEGDIAECPACGGLLRPDVVWFGERLPEGAMEKAQQAAAACDVFLSVGTSAVVYPAAGLPLAAAEGGAYTAEVNPKRSAVAPELDEVVLEKAGEALPPLVEAVQANLEDRA
jgi:NAD-dependent deacetylase